MPVRSTVGGRLGAGRVLQLQPGIRDEILVEARASYPLEACGILIGESLDAAGTSLVHEARAAENVASGDRRQRYSIAPRSLLRAQQEARSAGFEVIGYYHSHPDSPAVPSATDLQAAWPGVSYLIASIAESGLDQLRSWRLDPASEEFVEEWVEILAPEVAVQ